MIRELTLPSRDVKRGEGGFDGVEGDVVHPVDGFLGMKVIAKEGHEIVEALECGLGIERAGGGGDLDLDGEFGVGDGEVVAAASPRMMFSIFLVRRG